MHTQNNVRKCTPKKNISKIKSIIHSESFFFIINVVAADNIFLFGSNLFHCNACHTVQIDRGMFVMNSESIFSMVCFSRFSFFLSINWIKWSFGITKEKKSREFVIKYTTKEAPFINIIIVFILNRKSVYLIGSPLNSVIKYGLWNEMKKEKRKTLRFIKSSISNILAKSATCIAS